MNWIQNQTENIMFKNFVLFVICTYFVGILILVAKYGFQDLSALISVVALCVLLLWAMVWNISYRPKHDPVRKFCIRAWDVFRTRVR